MGNTRKIIVCNKKVKLVFADLDEIAHEHIMTGKGFRITQKGKTDKANVAGKFSIHSPLYGSDYRASTDCTDMYSCQCGELTGVNYEGMVCRKCKSKVSFVDIDITITGWMILDYYVIISPLWYAKINSFMGGTTSRNVLAEIIKYKKPENRNKLISYDGIGLIDFYNNFSKIMYNTYINHPNRVEMYYQIMVHAKEVFTHSIPVYSSHLRPFIVTGDTIRYTRDDTLYNRIFTNHNSLNNRYKLERRNKIRENRAKREFKLFEKLEVEDILYDIQIDVNELWEISFDKLSQKTGVIVNDVIGGRMNHTARNVIVPNYNLPFDRIGIGYTTFLELYKLEIVSLIQKMYSTSYPEAWDIWDEANILFSNTVYEIMNYIINVRKPIVEIGRNPTINYGSQIVMMIHEVSPDMNNYCMSLPENILKKMNADFDGDTLNLTSLKINSISQIYFKAMNPRSNLFISKNDGLYDADSGIYKDQAINIYSFCNI